MTAEEWGIVVGVVVAALLALGPWMFKVHAKLAVIATQLAELSEKMEKASEANRLLWLQSAQHEARLETHDVQFTYVNERLQEVA